MRGQVEAHGNVPIQYLRVICLIFFACWIGGAHAVEAPASDAEPFFVSTLSFNYGADYAEAYLSGDVARAVALSESAASDATTAFDRALIHLDTLYMCERIDDYACVEENLFSLLAELENLEGEQHRDVQRQAWVWMARFDIWRGEYERAIELANILNQRSQLEFSRASYLVLQDISRWIARENEDYTGARVSASRLIARLYLDPNFLEIEKAQYLSSALQHLLYSGDSHGARQFHALFVSYVRPQLAADVIGLAKYLHISATLNAEIGNFDEARARARDAASFANQLAVPIEQNNTFLSQVNNVEAISALLAGDAEAALNISEQNPSLETMELTVARGQFEDADELISSVVDILARRLAGEEIDERLFPLFSEPLVLSYYGVEASYYERFRLFGRGFLPEANQESAQSDVLMAAELQLVAAEERQSAFSNLYPLPSVTERIAIGAAIEVLSTRSEMSLEEQNLLLSAFDYLARGPSQIRGDALDAISKLQSERDQRIFQSYIRVPARKTALEMEAVWLVLQADSEAIVARRADVIASLAELAELESELALSQANQFGNEEGQSEDLGSPSWIADITEIRSTLGEDEAIIANLVSFGNFYRICIRPNQFQLIRTDRVPELWEQVAADARILRAALTATHQLSEELDSQFPANAALRLHDFLLGGLEGCLDGVARLNYQPLEDISDIPIQALLERMPESRGNGYDLGNAQWLLNKYSVSYLGSLREYTATAKLAARASGNTKFLGVGDPVLSNTEARAQALTLSLLGELPETAAELSVIQAQFSDATVLSRQEATEARVRQEDLSSYGILSFATHGVVAGELAGITEPGLILTPSQTGGNFLSSDGFLSATELAALELGARLVILSGCNTANIAPELFGRQVSGLAEALSIAGVPTTIASLWSVDSEATLRLMRFFLIELSTEPEQAIAVTFSHAIRRFMTEAPSTAFHHPRYWAAFAVFGAGNIRAELAPTEEPAALNAFERLDDVGGQIVDAVEFSEGEIIVSRLGDSDGVRLASYIERLSSEEDLVWRITARGIGGAKLTTSPDYIYAGNFKLDLEGALVSRNVRAFDHGGNLVWEWLGEAHGFERLVDPVLRLDFQGRLLVLWRDYTPSTGQFSVYLDRFDELGNPTTLWSLDLPSADLADISVHLMDEDTGPLLMVSGTPNVRGLRYRDGNVNRLGMIRNCLPESFTAVFSASTFEQTPQYRGLFPRLFVRKARAVSGSIFAAGRMEGLCNTGALWYPWFGSVTTQQIVLARMEEALPGGEFTNFEIEGEQALLVGHWGRQYSESLRPLAMEARFLPGEREVFEREELFVTIIDHLSERGQGDSLLARTQEFLGTGLSTYGLQMISTDEVTKLFGRVGEYPFTADVSWH